MITTRKLDCGVRIVMEDIPYVKSVALGIFVRAGAIDEVAKYSGISHYIEHMMFKGTGKRTAKQLAEDVDRIAGNINAYTAKENTCYHIKTLSSNLDKAVEILTDMFLNSQFDTVEMNRERNVIYEEMSMSEDTPDDLAYEMITSSVFKSHPLENSILGNRSSLKRISRSVLRDYIDREYTKDSIVISVAGNFNADHVCQLFNQAMSSLPESKQAKIIEKVPYEPVYTVKVKDIEQSHVMLATRSIDLGNELYYSMAVLNNAFGGPMSSRLFQNVREIKGLAYSVFSMNAAYSDLGAFMMYAGVSHKNIHKAVNAIKEELKLLKAKGLSEDEISMSKEQLKGNYIYGQENVNGRMLSIGKNMLLLDKIFTPEEVIADINKVSKDSISQCIDMITDIENYSASLVSNHRVKLKDIVLD